MTAPGALPVDIVRLTVADPDLARRAFAMMSSVFEDGDEGERLGDAHLHDLLRREEVWAVAAMVDGEPVGALTAHLLPMTRAETFELFIYDLAVRPDWQRRGVGRSLLGAVLDWVDPALVSSVFVPADNADTHALDFYRAVGGSAEPVTIFTFTPAQGSGDLAALTVDRRQPSSVVPSKPGARC